MLSQKQKNILIAVVLAAIILVSLFLAYQNGAIGKAVVQSVTG